VVVKDPSRNLFRVPRVIAKITLGDIWVEAPAVRFRRNPRRARPRGNGDDSYSLPVWWR